MAWRETVKGKLAELTGLCCPIKKSGESKGRPNFKKGDKSTEKTLLIFGDEHDAWCEAHEKRTGTCTGCMGDGKRAVSSSRSEGTVWGDCRKCGGSGRRGGNDG